MLVIVDLTDLNTLDSIGGLKAFLIHEVHKSYSRTNEVVILGVFILSLVVIYPYFP